MNLKKLLTNNIVIAVLALFACCLWGSAFPTIKIGYEMLGIVEGNIFEKMLFAGTRFIISGIMVFLFCFLIKIKIRITKKECVHLILLGLLQTSLQYTFFYIGLANTSGTTGSILSSLSTFFCVLLAPLFFKEEQWNKKKIIGVTIGFLGIVILNYQGAFWGFHLNGEGVILMSSIVSAFASIYTKKLTEMKMNSALITAYQLFIGGMSLLFIGLIGNNGRYLSISVSSYFLLVYMGFISAAGFTIFTILYTYNLVSKISIYNFSIPLFGTILSYFLLNENNIGSNVWIALLFVIVGILVINCKAVKKET